MKAISPATKNSAQSLLQQCISTRKVAEITGLSKSTVARIHKEMDLDKENLKGGRISKVSPSDQRQIVDRITSGRLETASEAARWLNSSSPNPVSPQTIQNILKNNDLNAGAKVKKPLLKQAHRNRQLGWAEEHRVWTLDDWK